MYLSMIVAVAENGVIGKDNKLPWHIKEDISWFRRATKNRSIIMGRKTFESIGRALPERENIIISTTMAESTAKDAGVCLCKTIQEALEISGINNTSPICLSKNNASESEIMNLPQAFIIGGIENFKYALSSADIIYYTRINKPYEGDTIFPIWHAEEEHRLIFQKNHEESSVSMSFEIWAKKNKLKIS